MSIWSWFIGEKNNESTRVALGENNEPVVPSYDASRLAFVDVEVGLKDHKIHDIGAVRYDGAFFHKASKGELFDFLKDVHYVCGHNIINHDAKYLFGDKSYNWLLVDTLYMSPLLFPERPYHKLVKDDKLMNEQINNPVNDCEKARDLLMDEIARWQSLPEEKRTLFASLLKNKKEFKGFLSMVGADSYEDNLADFIKRTYHGKICSNADIAMLVAKYPCELAYALALIDTTDYRSVTPGWVLLNYPSVEFVVKLLRDTPCSTGCPYCNAGLDIHSNLKYFFGYDEFRTYEGEPLQEKAARAAVEGKSLLAIFPTGGGKSLTFQLPALMEGRSVHGLTVVISPLQSLMKDQVDNLVDRGITDAVTINGLLDPISRALAIKRVQDGDASLLYIAPEMLRSKTIEKILLARHVVRFVIDEAHCFSSWGQDFRVDYLYIGKFIRDYQKKKGCKNSIAVSCFTATAKQKVVQDICDYFKHTLDIDLSLFASTASRTNLHYSVIHADTDDDKYLKLRELVAESSGCPTIIYVSRTKRTKDLASKLTRDGYKALPFNGRMEADEKVANQNAFMNDKVRIIVATSAFGMGVDKKDVGLVVHYDISDSLENYVQEAGRAGRDPHLNARCFVLYSDNDLDKHFILLNQTKLSISEIQQVWKAVKDLTRQRMRVSCSALEIARQAGWDDSVSDIETRVRTALATLEQGGYLERGNNVPHVYATGITVKNIDEARKRISESTLFDSNEIEKAISIIKSLISQKYVSKANDSDGESRVDYLADILGIKKAEVVSVVERMRQEGILADSKDISAYLQDIGDSERKSKNLFERFAKLEQYILEHISDSSSCVSCKQLNDKAINDGIVTSREKDIRTLLYFLTVKGYIRKREDAAHNIELVCLSDIESIMSRFEKRLEICRFTVEWLYQQAVEAKPDTDDNNAIKFSVIELLNQIKSNLHSIFCNAKNIQLEDVEEALLYLSKIGALKLEGGFLVLYNAMDIRRLKDNKLRYKQEDYRLLNEFYKQKIQQVHIVGEYANLMVRDYNAALQYVQDYFQMDYKKFVAKYFKGERVNEIQRNLTPEKYHQLFGQLSKRQMEIISDKESRCIVVAAGPGSGKTRVLVHKLASLLLLEDVKHEQLLMLTFSRAAATEFKQRLMDLIGNAAHFVEIKTFHSYCFDLLGRIGNLEEVKDVVAKAAEMISQGEVEPNKIGKTVLVIDEAQDMSKDDYALVKALMDNNEDMRVIAVGDDDQNIYEFRGSSSCYMYQLSKVTGGKFIEMTQNYRSSEHVVNFANSFVKSIGGRMKSTPIVSMKGDSGWVGVTRYASKYMYLPLVKDLLHHYNEGGTSCILTQTNEEAVIFVAMLRKYGINSKLVQSIEGFRFWNLAEMRYFLKYIDKRVHSPLISDELWEEAKKSVYSYYRDSSSLQYVKRCIELFEQTNKVKYCTDFKEYVFESSTEDFCDISGADVIVSTIHKAKGREFDNIYMFISGNFIRNDELWRRYYVGITRAKQRLFIHTDGDIFDGLSVDKYAVDKNQYPMPEEVVLQLSHKDVYLDFFKNRKMDILSLRGGDSLTYKDYFLFETSNNKPVARLSSTMQTALSDWKEKGYEVKSASVRFIVAWKPKDSPKGEAETAVLLADLILSRV